MRSPLGCCALLLSVARIWAETSCAIPPDLLNSKEPNIFSPEREADLGDAIAEQLRNGTQPIEDPKITAFLQTIGDRITSRLGVASPYHYAVVDMPITQAFSIAGGRIFVSRKLVAIAGSEDELAGVLGHEIGHAVTHQAAIRITRELKVLLGITEVRDRQDVFDKYNQLLESYRRDPDKVAKLKVEKDQIAADRVGLYGTAAAGYDPEAETRIFDRITGTNGETGNAFSNFFNLTSNESKRLRELLITIPKIPEACRAARTGSPSDFAKWKTEVAEYKHSREEDIPGLQSTVELKPKLRSDLRRLKFSPDGRFLLAWDESGISVLTHQPLAFVFHIDGSEIKVAEFDPSSQFVVLETRTREIEKWSLASKSRVERHDVFSTKSCLVETLSPDGRIVACLDGARDFKIQDVATGAEILTVRGFGITHTLGAVSVPSAPIPGETARPPATELTGVAALSGVHVTISPDARYLLAVGSEPLFFDLSSRTRLAVPKGARKVLSGAVYFLSGTRLLAVNSARPMESSILSVPDLQPINSIELMPSSYEPATNGDFVLMRPFRDFAVAVIDLNEHRVTKGSKAAAFDIYKDEFVTERVSGEIGLYGLKSGEVRASVMPPAGRLGRVRSAVFSNDGKWLAISNSSRGAVWNTATGESGMSSSAFISVFFRADDSMLADVSRIKEVDRHLALVRPARQSSENGPAIKSDYASLRGPFLLTFRPQTGEKMKVSPDGPVDVTLEMADAISSKLLWTRDYSEGPLRVDFAEEFTKVILEWGAQTVFAAQQIKGDPALLSRWDKMNRSKFARLYLIAGAATGKPIQSLLVDTGNGSFNPQRATMFGDSLILTDSNNRCLAYSLTSGELMGRAFGQVLGGSGERNLVAIENGSGDVRIHQLPSLQDMAHYQFPSNVLAVRFVSGEKSLMALTSNQKVFRVAIAEPASLSGLKLNSN